MKKLFWYYIGNILLLAGGVNAFANTIPTITKPIEKVIDGVATFQFNELMPEETSSVEITSDILEENGGKVSGAIPNVGVHYKT